MESFESLLAPGLSVEEKEDLERLMEEFGKGAGAAWNSDDEADETRRLAGTVGRLAMVILQMDRRLTLLREAVRLSHMKSEHLHSRIEELTELINWKEGGYVS